MHHEAALSRRSGKLFEEILRVLRLRRPGYFLLENVPGLLHSNQGNLDYSLCSCLGTVRHQTLKVVAGRCIGASLWAHTTFSFQHGACQVNPLLAFYPCFHTILMKRMWQCVNHCLNCNLSWWARRDLRIICEAFEDAGYTTFVGIATWLKMDPWQQLISFVSRRLCWFLFLFAVQKNMHTYEHHFCICIDLFSWECPAQSW